MEKYWFNVDGDLRSCPYKTQKLLHCPCLHFLLLLLLYCSPVVLNWLHITAYFTLHFMSWPLFYCSYFWPTASVGEQHPFVGIVRNCKWLQIEDWKWLARVLHRVMQNFLKANQGIDVIIGLSANKKVENRAKVPYAQFFFSINDLF